MTTTESAGGKQSLSPLFPEHSSQARRSSDTTLTLLANAASAEAPAALISSVLATTKASLPPSGSGNALDSLEASFAAPAAKAAAPDAVFQNDVTLATTPAVAMNSHQALNDPWPGEASGPTAASLGPTCGCRACSVLAVTTGDGAAAWDTTTDQAPLVINGLVTLGTGVNLSNVFRLHSNPTATKTIFLDFDGYQINNTPWENGGALSLRSFYSTFDTTALTEIQRIWQRVAEDFAPFNVNVTTQDPGTEALRKFGTGDDRWGIRVAFTSNLNLLTGRAITNAGGGGTAYYNSFNWSTDDVALVFNRGEYTAAETASHEVGHTLGLTHDGAGTTTEYYGGHGGAGPTSWGTIMGASWLGNDENLTQWSRGQYVGANNTQDDLATITNGNGFTYNVDDHGNAFSTATALTGLTFSSFGVIERNTDVDLFRFDTGAGLVTFDIVNASRAFVGSAGSFTTEYLTARGANLDIAATLYRADGSVVQTFNPADLTTASFSLSLAAGTYYLGIDGVGFGTPLASIPTGYTDYGSLGQYMVSGTVQPSGSTPPPTTTPPPPTSTTLQVLDPNGVVQLLRNSRTDLVSVRINGVSTPVRFSGNQLKASQFADRQILAAETNASGQNQILWKVVSTGQIRTWTLDRNWNFVSSNALTTPSSTAGVLLQQQFMVDASGSPLTSTAQNAALEEADPIIGGTSLAPAGGDDIVAPMAFGDALTSDPVLSSDPIMALTELASLGGSQTLATEPLASPFPATGSGASATTPWLVNTQPLL